MYKGKILRQFENFQMYKEFVWKTTQPWLGRHREVKVVRNIKGARHAICYLLFKKLKLVFASVESQK